MAKCEKCGKEYYTRECLKCKGKVWHYPTKDIKRKEKSNTFRIIMSGLVIIIMIGVAGGALRVYDLDKQDTQLKKQIKTLRSKNNQLETRNGLNEQLLNNLKKENQKLRNQIKYRTSRPTSSVKPTRKKKKRIKPTTNNYTKTIYSNSSQPKQVQQTQQVRQRAVNNKTYQKYTSRIKLISDSKITVLPDNRLKSNSQIYGRYYGYQQNSINCNRKENLYKVVDDCSMKLGLVTDEVYFSKSHQKTIKNYNRNNHMLECDYNQENGVFHDCKVKIYI